MSWKMREIEEGLGGGVGGEWFPESRGWSWEAVWVRSAFMWSAWKSAALIRASSHGWHGGAALLERLKEFCFNVKKKEVLVLFCNFLCLKVWGFYYYDTMQITFTWIWFVFLFFLFSRALLPFRKFFQIFHCLYSVWSVCTLSFCLAVFCPPVRLSLLFWPQSVLNSSAKSFSN